MGNMAILVNMKGESFHGGYNALAFINKLLNKLYN
jgi:hypothetical protein